MQKRKEQKKRDKEKEKRRQSLVKLDPSIERRLRTMKLSMQAHDIAQQEAAQQHMHPQRRHPVGLGTAGGGANERSVPG